MRIRKFNENIEEDFISIEEVKEIFAHLYDFQGTVEVEYKWLSGHTEYHLLDEKDEDIDVRVIVIQADIHINKANRFYIDYGVDSIGSSADDLRISNDVIKEIIDASKHLESRGYETSTQINSFIFTITIAKKGSLVL